MGQKVYVKPSKTALKIGLIVSILFFIFGVFFIFMLIDEPESYIGIGFLSFWLIVVAIIITTIWKQLANYENNNIGLNTVVEIGKDIMSASSNHITFDEKLRKLDKLKEDGIISSSEYDLKRKEILEEKW
jgi:hypothetical protein